MGKQTKNVRKTNSTVQGTRRSRTNSAEPLSEDTELTTAMNRFDVANFSENIQCCYKIPTVVDATPPADGADHGTLSPGGGEPSIASHDFDNHCRYTVASQGCRNRYEYLHPCECPLAYIWEYERQSYEGGSTGQLYYKRDDGTTYADENGDLVEQTTRYSPKKHPSANNNLMAIMDNDIACIGTSGLYSKGAANITGEEEDSEIGYYSIRCESLNVGCKYLVAVSYCIKHNVVTDYENHYGGVLFRFTATDCVNYIGGQENGENNETIPEETNPKTIKAVATSTTSSHGTFVTGSQLIRMPDAAHGATECRGGPAFDPDNNPGEDGYDASASEYIVNIDGIFIQMDCVDTGRGETFSPPTTKPTGAPSGL